MESLSKVVSREARLAGATWGRLPKATLGGLKELVKRHGFSLASGDVHLLEGRWYVTHTGLLGLASRRHCTGIRVQPVREFCNPVAQRWAFKATVFKSRECKGFVGYGDADPSNVSPVVRGAEMRMAETRAVNRALRKAYGIGLCSVEEIGSFPSPARTTNKVDKPPTVPVGSLSNNGNGQPRLLRDRLCQLIRQHNLDPAQVKRYAADFCGTETLREASRELIEDFINKLAERAAKDREGLLCQLSSYSTPQQEVAP